MSFLAPAFLVGLAAVALPLLIHLLGRPHAPRRPLATIDFLLRTGQEAAPRRRLRELLLLAARMAAVAAVALVLARPVVRVASTLGVAPGAQSLAIVLDDSLSMRFRKGGETLFERARRQAREIVDAAGPSAEVTLVLASVETDASVGDDHARDAAHARVSIDAAQPTLRAVELGPAVRRAARLLARAASPRRLIVVVTDGTRASWPAIDPHGPPVRVIDVAEGVALQNRAVVGVAVESSGAGLRVSAEVASFSRPAGRAAIHLRLGGKTVASGSVELPADGRATKHFYIGAQRGLVDGAVALEGDALAEDDVRHFGAFSPAAVRVLIVNGDPRAVRHQDEAFYLDAALRAHPVGWAEAAHPVGWAEAASRESAGGGGGDAPIEVSELAPEALDQRLAEADVVVACNVKAFGGAAAAVARFVERGGGLLYAVGDNVDAEAANAELGALLPQLLATPWSAAGAASTWGESEASVANARRLGRFDEAHPVFAPFVQGGVGGLRSALFWKAFLLRPGGAAERRTLAEFDVGAPALGEARRGRGRVLLFASTLDRDWGDLAIRPAYLPLVQQAVRYLGNASLAQPQPPSLVGEPRRIDAGGGARLRVTRPDGRKRELEVDATTGAAIFAATDVGLHRVESAEASGAAWRDRFAAAFVVNVDPRESDFAKAPADARAAATAAGGSAPMRRAPVWPALAATLIGILLVESLLGRRR